MAIERTLLPIALNSPMDTKTDPKLTNQEMFLLHQNTRFQKIGTLKKRYGYEQKNPTTIVSSYPNLDTRKILSDSDNLVFISSAGERTPYAYRESTDNFVNLFPSTFYPFRSPCEISGSVYTGVKSNNLSVDSDYLDGMRATIYFSSDTELYLDLLDEKTGFRNYAFIDSVTRRNGVVRFFTNSLGVTRIAVYYDDNAANTGRVRVYSLDLASLTNQTFTTVQTTSTFCADPYTSSCVMAVKSGATTISIIKAFDNNTITTYSVTVATTIKTASSMDLRVIGDIVYIAYVGQNETAHFISYNIATSAIVDADRVLYSPVLELQKVTFDFITSNVIGFFTSVGYNASLDFPATFYAEHTISTSTTSTALERVGIASNSRCKKLGSIGDGERTLICVATDTPVQIYSNQSDARNFASMYVMAVNASEDNFISTIARYCTGVIPLNAVNPVSVNNNLIEIESYYYETSHLRTIALVGGAVIDEIAMVYGVKLDFRDDSYQKNFITRFSKNMLISGGYLIEYDSPFLLENGFFHSPSTANLTSIAGAGVAAGTYNVIIVYEYIDSKGQRYQSAPSTAAEIILVGAVDSIEVKAISYLNWKPCQVVAYMTTDGGSIYYRMASALNLGGASYPTGAYTYVYIDSVPTGSEEILYTTGGVLPNDPTPPFKFICSHQERVYGIDADYSDQISYSKKSAINAGAEFSDFQKIFLAASGVRRTNELVGLASLNEKLIIFRKASIYYFLGDGPNVLGEQNNFTEPELISNDIGCIEPQSIISSPHGVFFKSEKGIYLLDSSLQTKYIGYNVEAYNAQEIIASLLVEEDNLVYFKTEDLILVYDYVLERWNVDTVEGIDLGVFDKKTIVLQESNRILFESTDFEDQVGATPQGITMLVETGWIKLSGIQDFARIVKALILGKYKSSHVLRVDVYYDYDDTAYGSFDLTHNVAQAVYQFQIQLKKQKCEAIKFKIYDIPENYGESCELTNLTLDMGMKKGSYKTPKSRNY